MALAHHLGLSIVAEGVETDEDFDRPAPVRPWTSVQGYLFSRALSTRADHGVVHGVLHRPRHPCRSRSCPGGARRPRGRGRDERDPEEEFELLDVGEQPELIEPEFEIQGIDWMPARRPVA